MVTLTMLADGTIAKYTAVCIGRFDNTIAQAMWPDKNMVSSIVGLALNDAGDGASVEVLILGIVSDPVFSFIRQKPIYIGSGGYLTQTIPNQSVYAIGKATATNSIFVSPSQLYLLKN